MDTYDEEHHYLSTACCHGLHGMCRQVCKWCTQGCLCLCHHLRGAVSGDTGQTANGGVVGS